MRRRDGQDNVTHEQNILDYLQNRLSATRKDAFEQMMAEDAALAAEVEVMRAVRRELAAGPKLDNAEAVWERVSASIDAQAVPANDNRSPLKQVLKYAAVVLIAVGAWQVTVVPRISAVPEGFRTASEPGEALSLQVMFTERATLSDIYALLAPFEGRIVDGPSALGLVSLAFPDESLRDAARATLADNATFVEFVAE